MDKCVSKVYNGSMRAMRRRVCAEKYRTEEDKRVKRSDSRERDESLDEAGKYQNAFLEGADPFVMTWQGKYYLYATNDPKGYRVYVSDDFTAWEEKGYCLRAEDVQGKEMFWAPEVMERGGQILHGVHVGRTYRDRGIRFTAGSVCAARKEMAERGKGDRRAFFCR